MSEIVAEPSEAAVAPSNGVSSVAAQRAATLAAMEAGEHLEKVEPVVEEKAPAPEPEETETEETEDAPADEESEDDSDEDETDEDEDSEEKPADAEKTDPDLSKRLAQVKKAERRSRESLAKDTADRNAAIDRRVADIEREWAPRIEKAERFEKMSARAHRDGAAILRELGLSEEADIESTIRDLFAMTKAGAEKPGYREHAQKLAKDRERDDKIKAMEDREEARVKRETEREQQAAADRHLETYFEGVTKAANDEKTPHAAHRLAKTPVKARAALENLAAGMAQKIGALPDAKAVLAAFEKQCRAELEELGIDPATVVKAKAPAKVAAKVDTKAAPKKKDGTAMTLKEQREETLRKLEAGELD